MVVSTRIRIARNLKNYRVSQRMSIDESEKLTQEVLNAMKKLPRDVNYKFIRINSLSSTDRVVMIEEHLISPGLIKT